MKSLDTYYRFRMWRWDSAESDKISISFINWARNYYAERITASETERPRWVSSIVAHYPNIDLIQWLFDRGALSGDIRCDFQEFWARLLKGPKTGEKVGHVWVNRNGEIWDPSPPTKFRQYKTKKTLKKSKPSPKQAWRDHKHMLEDKAKRHCRTRKWRRWVKKFQNRQLRVSVRHNIQNENWERIEPRYVPNRWLWD